MQSLLRFAAAIDGISKFFGIIASVLVALSCLISALNALSRYLFNISGNAYLEIQWQMFAGVFLLGAPWVLKLNEHVRVDLVYGSVGQRGKLWIDVLGLLFFLFPACFIMLEMSIPWVWTAMPHGCSFGAGSAFPWFLDCTRAGEVSANAGGLPVWPVKLLLPVGFVLLWLQGIAELIRRIAALRGVISFDTAYEKPVQ